jgi:hypothetical protein
MQLVIRLAEISNDTTSHGPWANVFHDCVSNCTVHQYDEATFSVSTIDKKRIVLNFSKVPGALYSTAL